MATFDYFVVFAEMRTGSNFLETNLNAFSDITCHGEAFNPHFIGYPQSDAILGVTQAARDDDPKTLLRAIRQQADGIGGFRYFHDHDPRILDEILDDQRCAKIILTRNPVDSYVSWKIAQATGQWKLTDAKARKDAKAHFDAAEFQAHVQALQDFQLVLLNRLQTSGQTAFYVAYEDLQNVQVMNGVATYLGAGDRLDALDKNLKVQNPKPVVEKVENVEAMARGVAELDSFNLSRTPNFEPRRGPAVPTYVTAASSSVLYMPMRGGPDASVRSWLAALDGVTPDALPTKRSQGELRKWMRQNKGHRRFTVLRHPVARAHHVFCHRILNTGDGSYPAIRRTLQRRYKLPLPETETDAGYDLVAHRAAFAAFLMFLNGNLSGQTTIRVDPDWASQVQVLQGFGEFILPDRMLREETAERELQELMAGLDHNGPVPRWQPESPTMRFDLKDIYDRDIEKLVRNAYGRDYVALGFSNWM